MSCQVIPLNDCITKRIRANQTPNQYDCWKGRDWHPLLNSSSIKSKTRKLACSLTSQATITCETALSDYISLWTVRELQKLNVATTMSHSENAGDATLEQKKEHRWPYSRTLTVSRTQDDVRRQTIIRNLWGSPFAAPQTFYATSSNASVSVSYPARPRNDCMGRKRRTRDIMCRRRFANALLLLTLK